MRRGRPGALGGTPGHRRGDTRAEKSGRGVRGESRDYYYYCSSTRAHYRTAGRGKRCARWEGKQCHHAKKQKRLSNATLRGEGSRGRRGARSVSRGAARWCRFGVRHRVAVRRRRRPGACARGGCAGVQSRTELRGEGGYSVGHTGWVSEARRGGRFFIVSRGGVPEMGNRGGFLTRRPGACVLDHRVAASRDTKKWRGNSKRGHRAVARVTGSRGVARPRGRGGVRRSRRRGRRNSRQRRGDDTKPGPERKQRESVGRRRRGRSRAKRATQTQGRATPGEDGEGGAPENPRRAAIEARDRRRRRRE